MHVCIVCLLFRARAQYTQTDSVRKTTLRTYEPIATAHRDCAGKFTRHVMRRARALCTKLKNDMEDGH